MISVPIYSRVNGVWHLTAYEMSWSSEADVAEHLTPKSSVERCQKTASLLGLAMLYLQNCSSSVAVRVAIGLQDFAFLKERLYWMLQCYCNFEPILVVSLNKDHHYWAEHFAGETCRMSGWPRLMIGNMNRRHQFSLPLCTQAKNIFTGYRISGWVIDNLYKRAPPTPDGAAWASHQLSSMLCALKCLAPHMKIVVESPSLEVSRRALTNPFSPVDFEHRWCMLHSGVEVMVDDHRLGR